MQRIIILNGPAGVGKTTVGRLLAGLSSNGVCIHGDDLRNFIVTYQPGQVEGGLGYKNAATLATNFFAAGYETIVVDYVFEQPRHVQRFLAWAPGSVPIHLFTLWAPLARVLEREQARPGRERLGERVLQCYRALETNLAQLGTVIINDGAEPEAVAQRIKAAAEAGEGRIWGVENGSTQL